MKYRSARGAIYTSIGLSLAIVLSTLTAGWTGLSVKRWIWSGLMG